MVREMAGYIRLFEKRGFENLVLSVKSASVLRTIEANRAIAEAFDYPIHIGLTHAGLPEDATVPSSVALGVLLSEGIGDTIRVSMAGDPVQEVLCGRAILRSLGLRRDARPELIVCPTCGRCQVDVVRLARRIRKLLGEVHRPIRVAVMGCIVNGPGEAADADLAICAGKGKAFLFRQGKKIAVVDENDIHDTVKKELAAF
jgi:(E)-4-hydroxy-3-methylbut-2-enyl-diphosphate synthase